MCFRGNFHNVIYVQTIRVFFFPIMLMCTFAAAAAHSAKLVHAPNKILSGSFSFIIVCI